MGWNYPKEVVKNTLTAQDFYKSHRKTSQTKEHEPEAFFIWDLPFIMHFAGIVSKFQGVLIEYLFVRHCYKSITRRNKDLENKMYLLPQYLLPNTCLPGAKANSVYRLLFRDKAFMQDK